MKMKKLVMTFYNKDSEIVSELSKDPANPQDVMSAINFLDEKCELHLACYPCDENGNIID